MAITVLCLQNVPMFFYRQPPLERSGTGLSSLKSKARRREGIPPSIKAVKMAGMMLGCHHQNDDFKCHLVMTNSNSHGKSPFLIGKPSISIGHGFHGYVKLPEGMTFGIENHGATCKKTCGTCEWKRGVNHQTWGVKWFGVARNKQYIYDKEQHWWIDGLNIQLYLFSGQQSAGVPMATWSMMRSFGDPMMIWCFFRREPSSLYMIPSGYLT